MIKSLDSCLHWPKEVSGTIGFLGPCSGKPASVGSVVDNRRLPIENRQVNITACSTKTRRDLDTDGVIVHRVPDLPRKQDDFLETISEHLLAISGAKELLLINVVRRRSERSHQYGTAGTTVPGRFAHTDFNTGDLGGAFWVRRLLGSVEAELWLSTRCAIFNVWRPLSSPPLDVPLAFCEPYSVRKEDLVATDCIGHLPDDIEAVFEMTVLRFHSEQRWSYFPQVDPNDVVIFKGYDSDSRRTALIPHAAFDDSTFGRIATPRESIEARFLARF